MGPKKPAEERKVAAKPRRRKAAADYPPFSALQLILRDYLQAPPNFFRDCRLVNRHFKSAVEAANPPCTWHIPRGRLNTELQSVVRLMTSEPRWEWVTKIMLSGGDVSMTQENCELLVAALGSRAWESISLVEVKLKHPLILPAIIETSAARGTLRHLSIADSPVSAAGLQSALSSLRHCLRTLELPSGITFHAPFGDPKTGQGPIVAEPFSCPSVRELVLGHVQSNASRKGSPQTRGGRDRGSTVNPPGILPVHLFSFDALQTLWLIGLGRMSEDDVSGIFRRTPLLEEFRLFNSGRLPVRKSSGDVWYFKEARAPNGGRASLTPAAVAGVLKGLTRHRCPRLTRLSIGWKGYDDRVANQELRGSWLRRFADAYPRMTEVNLFLTGRFPSEDWLYAVEKWAPTLVRFAGHFGGHSEAEPQLVLLAKAPELRELKCLGETYREEIEWMRAQSPRAFPKLDLEYLGRDVSRRGWVNYKYAWLLDTLTSRRERLDHYRTNAYISGR